MIDLLTRVRKTRVYKTMLFMLPFVLLHLVHVNAYDALQKMDNTAQPELYENAATFVKYVSVVDIIGMFTGVEYFHEAVSGKGGA